MNKRQAIVLKLQAQLTHWLAEIERLKKKKPTADVQKNRETSRHIRELRVRRDATQKELNELKKIDKGDWLDLWARVPVPGESTKPAVGARN